LNTRGQTGAWLCVPEVLQKNKTKTPNYNHLEKL